MTISGSGANINYNPQPTIFEQITTASEELRKQGSMGLQNTVIQSDTTDILFTQLENRNKWNYKSEAGRPNLKPAGSFRSAGPDIRDREGDSASILNELISKLPKEVQEGIKEGEAKEYAILKNLLETVAQKFEMQRTIAERLETKDASERAARNENYADALFKSALDSGKKQIAAAKNALNVLTPNDPDYLNALELLGKVEELMG